MILDQGNRLSFDRSSDAAGRSGRDPFGRGAERSVRLREMKM